MGVIVCNAAPQGSALQQDFNVRVRACGQEQWQTLDCYQVWVDMHEKRAASMACFDFSDRVEVEITCPKCRFPEYLTKRQFDVRSLAMRREMAGNAGKSRDSANFIGKK